MLLTTVFVPNEGGFQSIRIPSLIVSRNHTLLAFAEGRSGVKSDQEANKIIMKRSTDGGKTWSSLRVIEDEGRDSLNNPCTVVDQGTGRIFLMYQRIPAGYSEGSAKLSDGFDGPGVYRSCLTWSDDDGASWAPPEDVTRSVKRAAPVKTICSGPGIGSQLTRGAHKGRLIFPFNEGPFWQWQNYAVYSDDHGRTWRYGANAPGAIIQVKGKPKSQINEVQMVELSDGSVLLNSRQFAGPKVRRQAISHDGGETWDPVTEAPDLSDPSCMASILRYRFGRRGDKGVLLYSGPAGADRDHGAVHVSTDDGKSWPHAQPLFDGEFAYSILTKLPDGRIGCLFETGNYKEIRFATFDLAWATGKGEGSATHSR